MNPASETQSRAFRRAGSRRSARTWPHRRANRGIYLISTLLLLTFLVMLGGAIAVSFQQGLASSGSFNNRQMALSAAMSGLQYVQARLETNPSTYGPGFSAPASGGYAVVSNGRLTVREAQDASSKAVNVCGYLTNDNREIAGADEAKVYLMFRVSFNGSYTEFAARPADWGFVSAMLPSGAWNSALGPMPYVSMNNVLRSTQIAGGSSYTASGGAYKSVPGGVADVVVEGLVVTPEGSVLARRYVEGMLDLVGSQSPTSPGPATAALDLQLNLYQPEAAGGKVLVDVARGTNGSLAENAGLAAYGGNIVLNGIDAAKSSTAPPAYSAVAKASVKATKEFRYAWDGGSQSYNPSNSAQNVVQEKEVPPPAVKVGDLPAQVNPKAVAAGTWVVWNGGLVHYPTDYPVGASGAEPVNSAANAWSGGTTSTAPTFNGVAPDSQTLPAGVTFDPQTNTIKVSNDVLVSSAGGANGFALVVAPSANQPLSANSAAVGSAQIVFDASSGTTPQLRSPGSVSVLGNVTGQGALVSTGLASGSASMGNVSVVGKSSLDPRTDSGVALYAAGSVNMLQLSYAQSPSSVPAVRDTLASLGVEEGGGASADVGATNITDMNQALYKVVTQAMMNPEAFSKLSEKGFLTFDAASQSYALGIPSDKRAEFGDIIKEVPVSVLFNSKTPQGPAPENRPLTKLKDVAEWLAQQGESPILAAALDASPQHVLGDLPTRGVTARVGETMQTLVPPLVSQPGWDGSNNHNQEHGEAYTVYTTSAATFGNYVGSGAATGGSADPKAVLASLDQTFSGLVYAGGDLNMRNGLGNLTINGLAAAYGGDPATQRPGEAGGGSINFSANGISLLYDPAAVGPYLYLFGGVKLRSRSLTNF